MEPYYAIKPKKEAANETEDKNDSNFVRIFRSPFFSLALRSAVKGSTHNRKLNNHEIRT